MYETGAIFFLVLGIIALLGILSSNIVSISKSIINDEDAKFKLPCFIVDFLNLDKLGLPDNFTRFLILILICLVSAWVWPLIVLLIIWAGIIFPLRSFVRLRKKVNKALTNKNTDNHTHDWED